MSKKAFSLFRDNLIIYILNKFGWTQSASAYNWLTTEISDSVGLLIAGKIGVSSIHGKFLILLIISSII